jgi:hypothetical protein
LGLGCTFVCGVFVVVVDVVVVLLTFFISTLSVTGIYQNPA